MAGLAVAEVVCRCLEPAPVNAYAVAAPTANQYEFYQFDPVLGWSNAPNTTGTFQRDEFSYRMRINRHGMRDRDVSVEPPPDRLRVAVLGDSFVWGIGVADAERFTERLAAIGPYDVLNFGVSGYGPLQHLLMLDRVLEFRPAVVVVAFCLDNDFSDNVLRQRYGYLKPHAWLDACGDVAIAGYPLRNVKALRTGSSFTAGSWSRALVAHSALVRRVVKPRSAGDTDAPQAGLVGFSEELIYRDVASLTPSEGRLRDAAIRINKLLLARIRERVERAGARMVLLAVPTKGEYPASGGVRHGVVDSLRATAKEIGVPLIDPVDQMSLADFWKIDGHWHPGGHQKIATALAAWLDQHAAP